ncbi:OPT oligopeptide transporter protein-domain-containing protein, partial [Syncephalis fuscata]
NHGRFRDSRSESDDIHAKLMDRYDEVPDWWYGLMFVANIVLAIVVCEVFGIDLPWWGVILAVALAAIFIIPAGIITAVTNQTPGIDIITELIIGFILPGRAIANVTFKAYGHIAMYQGIAFLSNLKLGHYMKIPPRHMFIAQSVGTIIAGLPDEPVWNCSNARIIYSCSVIWGTIGQIVCLVHLAFTLLLTVPFWLLSRRYPNSWFKYIHIPVFTSGTAIMPLAQPGMYTSWFLLAFVFQFVVYRYRNVWWSRFNYVLSAGMILYKEVKLEWWGNEGDCPNF